VIVDLVASTGDGGTSGLGVGSRLRLRFSISLAHRVAMAVLSSHRLARARFWVHRAALARL